MSKLPIFYALFDQCGYVPVEKFDEILSEKSNIYNSPERNLCRMTKFVDLNWKNCIHNIDAISNIAQVFVNFLRKFK